jgi:LysR family carnitine catabolism transcriptional activator
MKRCLLFEKELLNSYELLATYDLSCMRLVYNLSLKYSLIDLEILLMTLRQLKAFLAVAQTLSFAEASNKVFLSQPALSLAIKSLEESVGGRLLVRTTRSVSLTAEGKTLYDKGRRLVDEWDAMEEEMRQLFCLERGMLSLAAMPSFAANQLPDVIGLFRQKFPAINVQINDVIAEETVAMVRSGKVELGVTFRPPGLADLDEFTKLTTDEFVSVVPFDHPLSQRERVSWLELIEYDFIALQRPSMVRMLVEETLLEAGIELDVAFDSHQLATVGRMVSNGLGVSVVPALCAQQMEGLGAKVIPVHSPTVSCDLGILTKQKHQLSVPAQAMFEFLMEFYSIH